jgi:citrate lyase beta subunit
MKSEADSGSSAVGTTASATPEHHELFALARQGQAEAVALTDSERAHVPVAYLSQQAHLTAPASNFRLAEKALADAYVVARRLLEKYGIDSGALGDRLGVPAKVVDEVLESGGAPVVLVDLEDGVAPQLVPEARENAVRLSREVDRGSSLCFIRTAGITDERCTDDLLEILLAAGEGLPPDQYPIDGIVFAKVRHVHEVEWLYSTLALVESTLRLQPNRIRVGFQIETGWGVLNLPDLARAGRARLVSIILGTVDLGADLMLPDVHYHHPINEWARAVIVAVGGALGVPAIDGMTLDFPVGKAELTDDENRELVLDRMRANFDDASHSIGMGMSGRWVGHPLQLLATTLAFRAQYSAEAIAADVERLTSFAAAIASGDSAGLSADGELLDIATDRHLRNILRRATAWGLISRSHARELDLISVDELAAWSE